MEILTPLSSTVLGTQLGNVTELTGPHCQGLGAPERQDAVTKPGIPTAQLLANHSTSRGHGSKVRLSSNLIHKHKRELWNWKLKIIVVSPNYNLFLLLLGF